MFDTIDISWFVQMKWKIKHHSFIKECNVTFELPFQQAIEKFSALKRKDKYAFQNLYFNNKEFQEKWIEFCREHKEEIDSWLEIKTMADAKRTADVFADSSYPMQKPKNKAVKKWKK